MKTQIITRFTLRSAVALSVLALNVQANENPFSVTHLKAGYQLADAEGKSSEGKCGEGKCGEGKNEEKDAEGKCGEGKKEEKDAEGKCGAKS